MRLISALLVLSWASSAHADDAGRCDKILSGSAEVVNFAAYRSRALLKTHGLGKLHFHRKMLFSGKIDPQQTLIFAEQALGFFKAKQRLWQVSLRGKQTNPSDLATNIGADLGFIYQDKDRKYVVTVARQDGIEREDKLFLVNWSTGQIERPYSVYNSMTTRPQYVQMEGRPFALFGSKHRAVRADGRSSLALELVDLVDGKSRMIKIPDDYISYEIGNVKTYEHNGELMAVINQGAWLVVVNLVSGEVQEPIQLHTRGYRNRDTEDPDRIGELQLFTQNGDPYAVAKAWSSVFLINLETGIREEIPTPGLYSRGNGSAYFEHIGRPHFVFQTDTGVGVVNLFTKQVSHSWKTVGKGIPAVLATRDHVLIVAADGKALRLLDALTGEVLHHVELISPAIGRVRLWTNEREEAFVLVGTENGHVYQYQLSPGRLFP